ncbi:Proteasome subunit alpha type-2 [Paramarasmius palmivorus]|uniref:Proteasome subunit alpha type-2 n=1 Tax=Paramarasmius palmivorus TaxID=297713 RepID=A0AAW0EEJ6_9AGAR
MGRAVLQRYKNMNTHPMCGHYPLPLLLSKDTSAAAELGMSAISKAPDQTQIALIAIALVITFGFLLYLHLRRLYYPCLTISELNKTETRLRDTFDDANSTASLCGYELEEVTQAKLRLEERASEIRFKSLQGPPSFWKTRLGIEIELIPTIVEWYTDVVQVERKILINVETVKRFRINNELKMREATYTPADAQPVAITGREVLSPQVERVKRYRINTNMKMRKIKATYMTYEPQTLGITLLTFVDTRVSFATERDLYNATKEGLEGKTTEKTIEIGVISVPTAAMLEEGQKTLATGRPKATFRKLTEKEVWGYLASQMTVSHDST